MSATALSIVCLALTLFCYYACKYLYLRHRVWWLAPIFLVPLVVIGIVALFKIDLPIYFKYTHLLVMLLAPATVAFALPIYRERALIQKYPITIFSGVVAGLFLGMFSSWLLIKFIPLPTELAHSFIVRSISTPFAVEATTSFGGIPELTAVMVVMTGVVGILICEPIFKLARIRTSLGRGVALGASAHGAGASKATEYGREEGVVASLTMIFAGVSMVLGAPFFAIFIG